MGPRATIRRSASWRTIPAISCRPRHCGWTWTNSNAAVLRPATSSARVAWARLPLWERAADLYRGDFLADAWDDCIVFRREGLKDQYLYVLARLADAALEAGDC